MIGSTLQFIAEQMNDYVCNVLKLNPANNKVLLSSIVDPNGALTVRDQNVLLIKLVNIEPDPIANGSDPIRHFPKGSDLTESAPLYLNLQIILAAYSQPEQVKSGLDMLTLGIAFLQGKSMWNPQNTPQLPEGVERLVFEMGTLDLHQLNHVWGAIGTKYLPSAIYKVKMLTIDDHAFRGLTPTVQSVSTDVNRDE